MSQLIIRHRSDSTYNSQTLLGQANPKSSSYSNISSGSSLAVAVLTIMVVVVVIVVVIEFLQYVSLSFEIACIVRQIQTSLQRPWTLAVVVVVVAVILLLKNSCSFSNSSNNARSNINNPSCWQAIGQPYFDQNPSSSRHLNCHCYGSLRDILDSL